MFCVYIWLEKNNDTYLKKNKVLENHLKMLEFLVNEFFHKVQNKAF